MSLCKEASQAVKSAQAANAKPKTGRADARQQQRMHRGTLPGDPITMTEMSRRIACLRRDTEFTERKALLQTIVDLDLGRLDAAARGSPCLWRLPLTDPRRTMLDSLGVPLDRYSEPAKGLEQKAQRITQSKPSDSNSHGNWILSSSPGCGRRRSSGCSWTACISVTC